MPKTLPTDVASLCSRSRPVAAYLYIPHAFFSYTNFRMRMCDTWFLGMRTLTGSHVVSGHAYTDAQPRGFLVGSASRQCVVAESLVTSEYILSIYVFIHGKQQ